MLCLSGRGSADVLVLYTLRLFNSTGYHVLIVGEFGQGDSTGLLEDVSLI